MYRDARVDRAGLTCDDQPVAVFGSFGAALAALTVTAALAPHGVWSGDRLVMTVMETGVRVQGDCSDGLIPAPIRPDAHGRFVARGSYSEQSGGPQLLTDEAAPPPAATYTGSIDGDVLRLTIKADGGTTARHFSLMRAPRFKVKCRAVVPPSGLIVSRSTSPSMLPV